MNVNTTSVAPAIECSTSARSCRTPVLSSHSIGLPRVEVENLETTKLFEKNYRVLVRIANRMLAHDRLQWTLESNELVHEMYLRIGNAGRIWASQEHFLGAAAIAMGHLLIDLSRKRDARKRRANIRPVVGDRHAAL